MCFVCQEEAIHIKCMDEFEKVEYEIEIDWICPVCSYPSDSDEYDSEEEQKAVVVPPIPPRAVSV
jgi:hypothetical protein